jgi:hypothetical protein
LSRKKFNFHYQTGAARMRSLKVWFVLWMLVMGVAVYELSAQPPRSNDSSSSESADDDWSDGENDRGMPGDRDQPPQGPPGGRQGPEGRGQMPGPPPGGGFMDLALIKKTDPELYKAFTKERELGQSAFKLARKVQRAAEDKQEQLKDDLKKLVEEKFAAGQKRRELELAWRTKNKQQIIDKEISNLTTKQNNDRRGPGGPPGESDDMPSRQQ